MDTPVDILTEEFYPYLSDKKIIMKMSGKWSKRTKKMHTKWPKEGSFDKGICDQMLGIVTNYKANDKSAKREKNAS